MAILHRSANSQISGMDSIVSAARTHFLSSLQRQPWPALYRKSLSIVAVFLLCGAAPAPSAPSLFDAALLREAVSDIEKFPEPELTTLADMLAACDSEPTRNETLAAQCQIGISRYRIRFGADRAIDQILRALILAIFDSHSGNGNPALTTRIAQVAFGLELAANLTFKARLLSH